MKRQKDREVMAGEALPARRGCLSTVPKKQDADWWGISTVAAVDPSVQVGSVLLLLIEAGRDLLLAYIIVDASSPPAPSFTTIPRCQSCSPGSYLTMIDEPTAPSVRSFK